MKTDDLTSPPHGVRRVVKPSKYLVVVWALLLARYRQWKRHTSNWFFCMCTGFPRTV